jgi:DNA-binding CsgD family transcriptional regulator
MREPLQTEEFEQELFELIQRLLPVDGIRFSIYAPWAQLKQERSSDHDLDGMMRDYTKKYWALDPMHPSHYEDSDQVVICNSQLMNNEEWSKTEILNKFYQPNGYFHNCDMFLKQKNRIVAVLSLIRKNASTPFTKTEINLLRHTQPFIEYCLGKIYISERVHNRSSLIEEYNLTAREVDVIEIALTGVSNKILCRHLGISLPTLRTHMQRIYSKVDVHSNAELISKLSKYTP